MSDDLEARLERARRIALEDKRSDAEVLARARAKARNEEYDPRIHGPFDEVEEKRKTPEEWREAKFSVAPQLESILDRFSERGGPIRPHLRVIPGGERENVRKVREQ